VRVRYTDRARNDLAAILGYIDERSPRGAPSVKNTIRKTIDAIGAYPLLGRSSGEGDSRVLRAGRYPYLIYWVVENGEVWLLHVRHTARRPL
jgi:toxin ParE1/3/4